MKLQKIYPILTILFFLSTCILLFQNFVFSPELNQISNIDEEGLKADLKFEDKNNFKLQISDEEIQRLMDIENEQKELVLLFERVSADLKEANNSKHILNQLLIGRSKLREFGNKFFSFKLFKKSGGFTQFLREKAKTYLSDGKLGVDFSGIKNKDLVNFRKEITIWIVSRNKDEIEAMA